MTNEEYRKKNLRKVQAPYSHSEKLWFHKFDRISDGCRKVTKALVENVQGKLLYIDLGNCVFVDEFSK